MIRILIFLNLAENASNYWHIPIFAHALCHAHQVAESLFTI